MNAIFKGAVGFVVGYLVFMVPTYVLPYLGSNSAIVGTIGAAFGRGPTPQFWLHFWCLVMLVLVTSIRAKNIGKGWLTIFPALAVFFDMVPVLNLIPLVPTVMHLFALVFGAKGGDAVSADPETENTPVTNDFSWEPWAAGLMTLSAMSGSFIFISGGKASGKQTQVLSAPAAVSPKSEPAKALGASAVAAKAYPSESQPDTAGQERQHAGTSTLATQTSNSSLPTPQVKKIPGPDQMNHFPQPKKAEGKATVRLIDINN